MSISSYLSCSGEFLWLIILNPEFLILLMCLLDLLWRTSRATLPIKFLLQTVQNAVNPSCVGKLIHPFKWGFKNHFLLNGLVFDSLVPPGEKTKSYNDKILNLHPTKFLWAIKMHMLYANFALYHKKQPYLI